MMAAPTRAGDAPTETQCRFLVDVMRFLPREQVREVYLFAPMKQGGVETGIAVVAVGDVHAPDTAAEPRAVRFTIHTARYRLQLKGPERGKWDVDVVEEADAPLVTVDAVVRGVHRRSGEPSEVAQLGPLELARALGEIAWTSGN